MKNWIFTSLTTLTVTFTLATITGLAYFSWERVYILLSGFISAALWATTIYSHPKCKLTLPEVITSLLVAAAILTGVIGLCLYYIKFNQSFSSSSQEWANFGAFISGSFAPASGIALLITILFFEKQFKQQKEINERQESFNKKQLQIIELQHKTLLMDQYERQQNWFAKKMSEVEDFYNNEFEIHSKLELYGRLFPDARADKNITKRVLDFASPHDSKSFEGIIERAESLAKKNDKTNSCPLDYQNFSTSTLFTILEIMASLNINRIKERENGDIIFDGKATCINILEIEKSLQIISRALGAITSFADIDCKVSITHSVSPNLIREKMLCHFTRNERKDITFSIFEEPTFRKIKEINLLTRKYKYNSNHLYILTETYLADKSKRNHNFEKTIKDLVVSLYQESKNQKLRKDLYTYFIEFSS